MTKPDTDKLEHAISIRMSAIDLERLEGIATRIPIATRHAIARAAIRIGLSALEKDPALVLAEPIAKRGGARARAKKRSGR